MLNSRLRQKLGQYIRERAITIADYEMFTLSSGEKTDIYVDMRKVTMQSDSLMLIGRLIYDTIKNDQVNAVGGPATGAIPIVAATVIEAARNHDSLNGFWVLKERKKHGTESVIEGSLPVNPNIWLVDDVATTGQSLARCIKLLEESGSTVRGVTILVTRDRKVDQLLEKLDKIHIHLFYLENDIFM
jgi:orotate phosphoribosyltransferase